MAFLLGFRQNCATDYASICAMKLPTPRRRGDGWRIEIMLDRKRRGVTRDTPEECLQWAAEQLADHKRGRVQQDRPSITLLELLHRYHDTVGQHKKGARREYTILNGLGSRNPELCALPIASITPAVITAWRNQRAQQVATGTVLREFAYLSAVLTYAHKELFLIEQNPFFAVTKPKAGKPRCRRISTDEIQTLLTAADYDTGTGPRLSRHWPAWALLFAIETAMRQGEILAMQWPHVRGNHVHLPSTKNGTARDVPLSTEARRLLALLDPQATGPVVPLSKNAFRLSSQRLWRKAGADFTFHDTRHEAISRMVRTRRLPVEILMKITGHKTASVLINTYYNPTVDELAEMLQ